MGGARGGVGGAGGRRLLLLLWFQHHTLHGQLLVGLAHILQVMSFSVRERPVSTHTHHHINYNCTFFLEDHGSSHELFVHALEDVVIQLQDGL